MPIMSIPYIEKGDGDVMTFRGVGGTEASGNIPEHIARSNIQQSRHQT